MTSTTDSDQNNTLGPSKPHLIVIPDKITTRTSLDPDEKVPMTWKDVTAEGLASLIGDEFQVSSDEVGDIVLTLTVVEPLDSYQRPNGLKRQEAVIAVFDSPDKDKLSKCAHDIYRVAHPIMGTADLFMTISPKGYSPKGPPDHVIELVLN